MPTKNKNSNKSKEPSATKSTTANEATKSTANATPTSVVSPVLISASHTNIYDKKRKLLQDYDLEVEGNFSASIERDIQNAHIRQMEILDLFVRHSDMLLNKAMSARRDSVETSCTHPTHSFSSSVWPATVSETGTSSSHVEVTTTTTLTLAQKIAYMFYQVGLEQAEKQESVFDQCQRLLNYLGDSNLATECSTLSTIATVNRLYDYFQLGR